MKRICERFRVVLLFCCLKVIGAYVGIKIKKTLTRLERKRK